MDVIRKKISLEPFYSRQKSVIPYVGMKDEEEYRSGLNWGRVAYGVNFSDEDFYVDGQKIPTMIEICGATATQTYGNAILKLGAMSFNEMMEIYGNVKNKRVDPEYLSPEELEKMIAVTSFIESKKIVEADADPTDKDPCCDIYPEPSPDDYYEMDDDDFYFPPSVAINIGLVQSSNIVGAYTFATKDWEAGRRYFEGDKVIYDGKTFELKQFGDTTGITIETISGSPVSSEGEACMTARFYVGDSVSAFTGHDGCDEVSELVFDDFEVNKKSDIVDFGYVYAKFDNKYYVRPSYAGYFNKVDGSIYFDELIDVANPDIGFKMVGGYDTVHWKIADKIISHGIYNVSAPSGVTDEVLISTEQNRTIGYGDVTITGIERESKLVNFKRYSTTICDDGTQLPGKINYNIEGDVHVIDLMYKIGTVRNVDTSGDVVIGDYLADIKVEPEQQNKIRLYITEETTETHTKTAKYPKTGQVSAETTYEQIEYKYTEKDHLEVFECDERGWFIGSIEKNENNVKVYTKDSKLLWDSDGNSEAVYTGGVEDYRYEINLATGSTGDEHDLLKYTYENKDRFVFCGETYDYQIKNKKLKDGQSFSFNLNNGTYSCNGEGFTIQPTGGTKNDYDVYAPKLLAEYVESGDTGNSGYVTFQTLHTYEKLVKNWAGERGIITFTYYIGAELELEKNDSGETITDGEYIYNGGKKYAVFQDVYRFIGTSGTSGIYDIDKQNPVKYVYFDIFYDENEKEITYKYLDNYNRYAILSNVTATTEGIVEGGSPVSKNFQNADYIMEDYQIGVSFVSNNNKDVYVDRGNATAFERHLRLTEAKTVQDLENLGNGSFLMKQ